VPTSPNDSGSSEGRPKLDIRPFGQFILWAVIALVGWSFYSTMQHETAIAVMDQRLSTVEDQIRALKP